MGEAAHGVVGSQRKGAKAGEDSGGNGEVERLVRVGGREAGDVFSLALGCTGAVAAEDDCVASCCKSDGGESLQLAGEVEGIACWCESLRGALLQYAHARRVNTGVADRRIAAR